MIRVKKGLKKGLKKELVYASLSFVFLSLGYTNCSVVDSSHKSGSTTIKSEQMLFCEQDLKNSFVNSYSPVLSDPGLCLSCHTEGGASPFKFASRDFNTAFSTFMRLGADRIDGKAIDAKHAAGVTGPSVQPRITEAKVTWDPAYVNYQKCLGGQAEQIYALKMSDSSSTELPKIYFGDGNSVTLMWNLNSTDVVPTSARFPGYFLVDVKVKYVTSGSTKVAVGYSFSNPRLQMATGDLEAEVEGVIVRINGVQISDPKVEPFLAARKTSRGIDPAIIYNGAVEVTIPSVSNGDKISVAFGYLNVRARTDNPPIPPTPTINVTNAFVRTTTVPFTVTNNSDSTARRWCLTGSTLPVRSAADPCPGYESVPPAYGWLTSRPTAFDLAKLGRPVLSGDTIGFSLWVANSDLKVSTSAGMGQVTFDSTVPSVPSLGSVQLGNTQIATLIGLQDTNEPVTWCVREDAAQASVTANGCTFVATKPNMVGLKGGGTRFVAVFARDRAGNTAKSNVVSVNNSYGQISYAQLTGSDARAVFANRCYACHGSGGIAQLTTPGWNALDYSATVNKKSQIMNRIVNAASPMPQGGLLSDPAEIALIQLWFNQTATPVQ